MLSIVWGKKRPTWILFFSIPSCFVENCNILWRYHQKYVYHCHQHHNILTAVFLCCVICWHSLENCIFFIQHGSSCGRGQVLPENNLDLRLQRRCVVKTVLVRYSVEKSYKYDVSLFYNAHVWQLKYKAILCFHLYYALERSSHCITAILCICIIF